MNKAFTTALCCSSNVIDCTFEIITIDINYTFETLCCCLILLLSLDCVTLFWNAKSMHYVLKVCNRLYRCWLLVAFMRFLCIHLNMPCHHISNTLVFIRPMEFRYNNRRTNAVSVWIVHVASDLHWLIVYSFNYDFSMARHELDCYLDLRVCFFFLSYISLTVLRNFGFIETMHFLLVYQKIDRC